ncbi:MAG: hypothetical protein QOJ40_951, partial [Verrucomicrobiota bacterium]
MTPRVKGKKGRSVRRIMPVPPIPLATLSLSPRFSGERAGERGSFARFGSPRVNRTPMPGATKDQTQEILGGGIRGVRLNDFAASSPARISQYEEGARKMNV